MTILEFLSQLRKSGVELQLAGDHLRISAPEGILTPSLKEELVSRKEEIIGFLKTTTGTDQSLTKISLHPRNGHLPLSYSQERLWFLNQLEPGSPAYNMPSAVRLKGALNRSCLERALNEILARHEVLRTNFDTIGDQPVQIIADPKPLPITFIDLSKLPEEEQILQGRHLSAEEARRPFDLRKDLLVRAMLVKLGEEDHIFMLTLHHIVSDGWSLGVFAREFEVLYQAFLSGAPSPLPPLTIQYADFAQWQRVWLQGEVLDKQLAYWKQQLAGIAPLLELPTDRPRPAVQTPNGAYQTIALSKDLSRAIKALCQHEGATLFMTLLSAFEILLYRYSHQEDICVGTPIANRSREELEGLIGCFVNTLVLRGNLSGEPSFRELLKRTREAALGAYAHQDVPFEMLVDAVQPNRDLSHSPLFQVMFVIQNAPRAHQISNNLTETPVEAHSGTAKFDLTLFMLDEADRLSGAFEYNTDLFDADTITRMIGHFEMLLQAIVANPNQSIATLPILTERERHQILVEWNDTAADYPAHLCAHHLFEQQVARTPDAIAVTFGDQHLTYAELNRRANQLARHLQNLGVQPETLTGICVERSLEMAIGLLGILKSGGAYVPLDPTYPADRLAFMLQDSGAPIVLTQAHLIERFRNSPFAIHNPICLDTSWDDIAREDDANPMSSVTPDNLAYVIYTSGSTGKPKGVLIIHRGLVNYLTWCQRAYPLDAGNGSPVHSSISFDLTVTALWAPLTMGRTVTLLPEGQGVERLGEVLREQSDFSLVKITPAHLELVSQQLSPIEARGCTRAFIIGGENLTAEHIAFWQQYAPKTKLVNEYGPTETVVGCCVYTVPVGIHTTGVIPIGRPIINTRLYVLDRHHQPVPIGVPGELHIGGEGVARGYLNRPNLTAEKFISVSSLQSSVFSNTDSLNTEHRTLNSRLYKTGDLVKWLPDGNLICLGRTDDQVKIRGFRVELGEIETVLKNHPNIRQALVIVREDSPGDKRLVAYLILEPSSKPATEDFRQYLRSNLPEYMVPSAFVVLDEFLMTPNGKINWKALPAPDHSHSTTKRDFVPPRTDIEAKLANIWTNILGVVQIDVRDNFFELGGYSLLAVRMLARIKEEFGINLPLSTLFQEATVEHLAKVITNKTVSSTWPSLVEIEPAGDHPPFFCIHGITGDVLWFRDLAKCLAPNYPFYALQARGLDGIQEPFTRIEAMATYYIEEMRRVQPKGPYFLGGASFGGAVALEIAQQLFQQGEEVALLAIFDQSPPNIRINSNHNNFKGKLIELMKVIRNSPHWFGEFVQLGPSRILMRVRRKLRLAGKIRRHSNTQKLEQLDAADFLDFADELSLHRQQLIISHYQAMETYRPSPYRGRVTLFRAMTRPLLSTYDPEAAWKEVALGPLEVINVPSSHEGMFRTPHVNYLAEQLKKRIAQALRNDQH